MGLQAEIGLLKKELDKIKDEHLINAIKELIKFSYQKREEDILAPFTHHQLISRAKQSEKNIRQRKFKSVNEARKEVKSW